MNATWAAFADWLLHSASGGGILLLLALPMMRACRQPARRQRMGESALMAALVLCVLNLGPSWISLPLLSPESSSLPLAALPTSARSRAEQLRAPKHPARHVTDPEQAISQAELAAGSDEEDPDSPVTFPLLFADSPELEPATTAPDQESVQTESQAPGVAPGIVSLLKSLSLAEWLALLAMPYAAASAFLLGRWLLGHYALWRLLRNAEPAPEAIYQLFQTLARGQGRRPRLLVSKHLRVPVSCGVLRPCVVLPASFCESSDAGALRWLFAHELTHLERGDAWTCLLFGLGQVLYFCLPWFWWLRRQVRLCQEYIADAAAVELTANPEDYAQFLISLTRAPAVPLGALGVLGNSSDLFRRVNMLLQSPIRVERCCPRWWSLATAVGLLGLALLVSGVDLRADAAIARDDTKTATSGADQTEPTEKPANSETKEIYKEVVRIQEEPAEKKQSKAKPAVEKILRDIDILLQDLSSALDSDQLKRLQEQLAKIQIEVKQAIIKPKELADPGTLDVLHKHLLELGAAQLSQHEDLHRKAHEALHQAAEIVGVDAAKLHEALGQDGVPRQSGGRLGVHIMKPGVVLADQLDLPKGQGLVIERVAPNSVAAKAGLKPHDVLLEFNGKPVPDEPAKFIKMVEEVKGNPPFDVILLRKGKKETVKGLSLAEPKAKQQLQFRVVPDKGAAPATVQPPKSVIEAFSGSGRRGVITTIFRTNDNFTTRHQEGSLVITVTGSVTEGKSKVKQIQIQDGAKSNTYQSPDKVPEQYRDKVKNLIEMSEKNNVKVEVGANSDAIKSKSASSSGIVKQWKIGPLKQAKAKDVYYLIKDVYKEHVNNTLGLTNRGFPRNGSFNSPAMNLNVKDGQPRGLDLTVSYDDQTNSIFLTCDKIIYDEMAKLVEGIEKDVQHKE